MSIPTNFIPPNYKTADFSGFNILDILDAATNSKISTDTSFPRYNIIRENDMNYRIELAIAGFFQNEIEITEEKRILSVVGKKRSTTVDEIQYVYKGISSKDFIRTFTLAESVEVVSAKILNGVLVIRLKKFASESKKKYIPIGGETPII